MSLERCDAASIRVGRCQQLAAPGEPAPCRTTEVDAMLDYDPRTFGDSEAGRCPPSAPDAGCKNHHFLAVSRMPSAVARHFAGTQEGRRIEHNALSLQQLRLPYAAAVSRAGAWSACTFAPPWNASRLHFAAAQCGAAGIGG